MTVKNTLFEILLVFIVLSCTTENQSTSGWQKVYQNDKNGQALFGDKSKLIDAVRLGYPVRIGWGGTRVEHVTDASFLTIFQGEEVFAQIRPIIGQEPRIDNDSLKIRFRKENQWVKMAGTNGYSTGFMINYFSDTVKGGGEDRYNSTTWYVYYPKNANGIEPRPLWRKESPNWEKWKLRASLNK
ncbi:MAG: hypothetical protein AAF348_01775 [Bacteroidota bacterium]